MRPGGWNGDAVGAGDADLVPQRGAGLPLSGQPPGQRGLGHSLCAAGQPSEVQGLRQTAPSAASRSFFPEARALRSRHRGRLIARRFNSTSRSLCTVITSWSGPSRPPRLPGRA